MNQKAFGLLACLGCLVLVSTGCRDDHKGSSEDPSVEDDDGSAPSQRSEDCERFGCPSDSLCSVAEEQGQCLEECRAGFQWSEGECVRTEGMDCSESGGSSLASVCAEGHRACLEMGGGAECGPCLNGYVEEGEKCRAMATCAKLKCEERHRTCDPGSGDLDATCGPCSEGFEEIEGECASPCPDCASQNRECGPDHTCGSCLDGFWSDGSGPCNRVVTCAEAACGAMRVCDPTPTARCLNECSDGWVWNEMTEECEAPKSCADLNCTEQQTCREGTEGQHARCIGSSCPQGEGRNTAGECERCAGWRPCDGIRGARAEVLATAQGCRCAPQDGYFPDAAGAYQLCDADEDGWTNDKAAATIEGPDPRLAACPLRTITQVQLINDYGETRVVDLASEFPQHAELPLYEHPVNDGDTSSPLPQYVGTPLDPAALNSFTKACVTDSGDFNRNGPPDVREDPGESVTVENAKVVGYFEAYRRFAYFLELADGWYSSEHTYTIRERSRRSSDFPLRYPESEGHEKWKTCTRHADTAYDSGGSQAGRDFSSFPAGAGWSGMNHHSQFKCVHAVQGADYTPSAPQLVQVNAATGAILWAGPKAEDVDPQPWYTNACTLNGSYRDAPNLAVRNTRLPSFGCTATGEPPTIDRVAWVAVGYGNGVQEGGVSRNGPKYVRGCINECAEHDSLLPEDQCLSGGGPGHGCRANAQAFGDLLCGCKRNFGGTDCSIACPDAELLTNIDASQFPDTEAGQSVSSAELRSAYWMCGGVSASSHYVLQGSGYTLRGEVSATPVDGTVLEGGGYRLRAF